MLLLVAFQNKVITMKLKNYAQGKWVEGDGEGASLYNSITGEQVATASSKGLDFD